MDEKLLAYNLSLQQLIDNWVVAFHPVSTMYITEYNAEYNVHNSNGKSQFISIEWRYMSIYLNKLPHRKNIARGTTDLVY